MRFHFARLSLALIIFLTACITNTEISSPTAPVPDVVTPTVIATKTPSITITPTPPEPAKQIATPVFLSNAPETLGTIGYLQYSYSIFHSYEEGSCTSSPRICPDVYYARLSDVHTWIYTQAGQTAWLEFNLNGKYQIRPSEEKNETCATTRNNESVYLFGITCGEAGEYTLKFGLVSEEQHLTYPLVLQFISVPELSPPPAVFPPELTIEEYELAQHPDTEPLFFKPITGTANTVLAKHETERGQSVEGGYSVYLDNGQLIQAEEILQATGSSEPSHVLNITITQNGNEIFSTQAAVSPITAIRGLWSIENHWFAEIAVTQDDGSFRSFTKGDVFKDGISSNETHGYTESFGFQLLHGKPFYFFEKFGRVGVSYDGQDIPLGYDYVPHNGCCSIGELNPKMYENMVGFFAVRGDKWYYVEIGVFE